MIRKLQDAVSNMKKKLLLFLCKSSAIFRILSQQQYVKIEKNLTTPTSYMYTLFVMENRNWEIRPTITNAITLGSIVLDGCGDAL